MKPKLCARTTIALTILAAAFGMNAHAWSVSGIVKSSSGTVLSGVAVTVKDSAKYSTTTDASGKFKLESSTAILSTRSVISGSYSINVAHGEMQIRSPRDGSIELSLVNSMGRSVWTADVVSTRGTAQVAFPTELRHIAAFLKIRHAEGTEYYSMVWGPEGLRIEPSQLSVAGAKIKTSAAAAATFPTLLFNKTDFHDTSFVMTSENMTDVAVAMAPSQEQTCDLPVNPKWTSSGILVSPKDNNIASVKDPTIQKYNGKYIVYATVFNTAVKSNPNEEGTFLMEYIEFTDFDKAKDAKPYYMSSHPGFGNNYRCAPELFYFEPQNKWYLMWQQQDPAYSVSTTPDDPTSWTQPKSFTSNWNSFKSVVTGKYGSIDYWPIANDTNFYIFCTGDDGSVYKTKTSLANFPNGFGPLTIVKRANGTQVIFEGSSHYKIKGTKNTYLHTLEGEGTAGARIYSAWTSEGLDGEWKEYKVAPNNPFMAAGNTDYPSGDWTNDISHGEFIRDNPNQKQELDPCNLQFLYQGRDPNQNPSYNLKPYRLGLLTLQK